MLAGLTVALLFFAAHPELRQLRSSGLEGGLAQQSLSAAITIVAQHSREEKEQPANSSGEITFQDPVIQVVVAKVTGLNASWSANVTLFTRDDLFPPQWTERAPTTAEIGTEFDYLDLTVDNESTGTYRIYFRVSQSNLSAAGVDADEVRLFAYETSGDSWSELSTTIELENSTDALFYAATTHFSKFIIGEKPAAGGAGGSAGGGGAAAGGGGGGGAGELAEHLNLGFSISPDVMEAFLSPGEQSVQYLLIQNRDARAQFAVSVSGSLSKYVVISDRSFTLLPGEERLVKISFYISDDIGPGIYTGEIKVSSATERNSFSDSTMVALEVKRADSLFDFTVRLLPKYKVVLPNSKLVSSISFTNIGAPEAPTDVQLVLKVVDHQKKSIVESFQEVVGIKGEDTIVRELQLPATIAPKEYLLLGEMKYDNITIYAYDTFKVAEIVFPEVYVPGRWNIYGGIWDATILIMLGIVFIVSLGGIILLVRFMHQHMHQKHRRTLAGSRGAQKESRRKISSYASSTTPSSTQKSPSSAEISAEISLPDRELERGEVVMLDKLKGKFNDLKDSFLRR